MAGAFGALFGVGGGVILVPMLSLVAGLDLRASVGASLISVTATSVAGSAVFLRRGLVAVPTAVKLQFFAALGATGASLAAPLVPDAPLYFVFALLLILVATRMWPRASTSARQAGATLPDGQRRSAGIASSLAAGSLAGLLGVGGGILYTPLLHLIFRLPFVQAAATSVYVIGITAFAASAVYLARGDVAFGTAGLTMAGAMIGSTAAAHFGHRVGQRVMLTGFALLMVFVAFQMARRGLASL
jgi:hypothetical protein